MDSHQPARHETVPINLSNYGKAGGDLVWMDLLLTYGSHNLSVEIKDGDVTILVALCPKPRAIDVRQRPQDLIPSAQA